MTQQFQIENQNVKHVQPVNQTKNVGAHQSIKRWNKEREQQEICFGATNCCCDWAGYAKHSRNRMEVLHRWKSRVHISHSVIHWPSGQGASLANQISIPANESNFRLEQLLPETIYSVNIVAVSDMMAGKWVWPKKFVSLKRSWNAAKKG